MLTNNRSRFHSNESKVLSTLLLAAIISATWHLAASANSQVGAKGSPQVEMAPETAGAISVDKSAASRRLKPKESWDEQPDFVQDLLREMPSNVIAITQEHVVVQCNVSTRENSPEFRSTLTDSGKTKRAALTKEELRESALRASSVGCESSTGSTLRIDHKRPLHTRDRFELLKSGDNIDNLMFDGRAPFWMAGCNPNQQADGGRGSTRVERAIENQTDPLERIKKEEQTDGSAHATELWNLRKAKPLMHRRKRSTGTTSNIVRTSRLENHKMYKFQDDDKSLLLVRARFGGEQAQWQRRSKQTLEPNNKWYKAGKTSFKLAKLNYFNHNRKQQHSKNRFLVDESNEPPISGSEIDQMEQRQLDEINDKLRAIPITEAYINYTLFRTYNSVEELERTIEKALELSVQSSERNGNLSEERRQEIISAHHKWMPTFEELFAGSDIGKLPGLYHVQTQELLANMTEYLELFSVALEQMMFDMKILDNKNQAVSKRKHLIALADLLRQTRCRIRNAENHWFSDWNELRTFFATVQERASKTLARQQIIDPLLFKKFINHQLARDRQVENNLQTFQSPIARAWALLDSKEKEEKLKSLDMLSRKIEEGMRGHPYTTSTASATPRPLPTYPTHFWRAVMPVEQRKLLSAKERAVRDISILIDMQRFLKSYKSLLYENWAHPNL